MSWGWIHSNQGHLNLSVDHRELRAALNWPPLQRDPRG